MKRRHRRAVHPPEDEIEEEPSDEMVTLDASGLILDHLDTGRALRLLEKGEVELQGLLPWSTNYTYLVVIRDGELESLAVYKPRRGERPLWDFAEGTLCQREVAAFLVSEALGWSLVPPTVLRPGPSGLGMVQLFVGVDPNAHYLTFKVEDPPDARRLAAFDVLINNADRKSGHILRTPGGRMWAIDHGVTFHDEPKLRTVVWDFVGQELPDDVLADIRRFRECLQPPSALHTRLSQLLAARELRALRQRTDALLAEGVYPGPTTYPYIPWPPV